MEQRIEEMQQRLERLVALWRAGKLPAARAVQARGAVVASVGVRVRVYPTNVAWLTRMIGYQVAAFGGQLRHLMSEVECERFLADCPQARRLLHPLVRMLSADPMPEVLRRVRRVVPRVASDAAVGGVVVAPEFQKLGA